MYHKIAGNIEMAFDIPDSEKQVAQEASMRFEAFIRALKFAVNHLNVIYDPFQKNPEVPTESAIQHRGLLNRLRGAVKTNFETAQKQALLATQKLDYFSTGDTDIQELVSGFVEAVDSLIASVSNFLSILKNGFRADNFRDKVIQAVEIIRKNASELENLVYDRIIEHIDTNILAKDWMQNTSDSLKVDLKLEKNIPLVQQLFQERQEKLDAVPSNAEPSQTLNAGDAKKQHYPNAITTMPGSLGGQ